jgi:hypothetical protein
MGGEEGYTNTHTHTHTHTPWHGDLIKIFLTFYKRKAGCKVTFLYFLLLIADFTENFWWHNELYLVVYSNFAPQRGQSLSPRQRLTTWRISKHSARSENHTKPINRLRGQNPGIFSYSNTWKHGRTEQLHDMSTVCYSISLILTTTLGENLLAFPRVSVYIHFLRMPRAFPTLLSSCQFRITLSTNA